MLLDCDLLDLGYIGPQFTWSNRREGKGLISKCLDICIGNLEWCNLYPKATVKHGSVAYSNHLPLILTLEGEDVIKM